MPRRRWALLLSPLLLCGCPPETPEAPSLPDPICTEGARWTPGQPAFRDATSDFGLDVVGAEGTRLSAGDLNGDGFVDVVVRRGGVHLEHVPADAERHTWVLLNDRGHGFTDHTEASGLLATRLEYDEPWGRPGDVWVFADIDNDGDLDAYTGLETANPNLALGETSEVMLNDGAGGFSFAPRDSGLRRIGDVDVPAGASFVDIDLDGNIDLWVPQHNYTPPQGSLTFSQDRLYLGDGKGRFSDATLERGLATLDWDDLAALNEARAHTRAWGAAACDLNGDGLAELLAPSYGRSPNHLWQARRVDGTVTFENRSVASGYAYDDNLTWEDNQFARCFCQANPTAEGCDGVGEPLIGCGQTNWSHGQDREPFRLGGNSAGTVCADIDNDGDLDLLTSEIRHWWAGSGSDAGELLVNTGDDDVRFERPGNDATGLAVPHPGVTWDEGHMTAAVFDFDNDGWLDVYVGASDYAGNRGRLFHQDAPLAFIEVPTEAGLDHNRSHGVVVADFDRDGDLDVLVGHSRARCDATQPNDCYPTQQVRLFENVVGDGGNFVQLVLEGGRGANRAAIGARVTVRAGGVTQTQEVEGGHGHYGAQNDRVLHFGLGASCEAEVTVRWPDVELSEERFVLPAGHRFRVVKGEGITLAAR